MRKSSEENNKIENELQIMRTVVVQESDKMVM